MTWTRNDYSYLLLTLALALFALAPLAYPGYLQLHSGFVPVYNLAELAGGPPAPGWTPGVATRFDPLRGDGLLPYYLALPLVWLGGTPLAGVKMVLALSFLLGAAGLYVWQRGRLGAPGAALAALVYTYLPYHIAVVTVRGAWGEALFWGLLPWALAAADPPAAPRSPRGRLALAALTWALLGLSQPGLALWALLLLLIWRLLDRRGWSARYQPLLGALTGTGVAWLLTLLVAGFSIPASPIHFFDHFLYPAQLLSAYWGFGASRPGWEDGMALSLGFAAVALALLSLFLALAKARTQSAGPGPHPLPHPLYPLSHPLPLPLLALALALLLFAPSALFWRLTGLFHTLAYPWQLLGFVGLGLSILAATSLRLEPRLAALPTYAALVILTLLASYSYLEPRFTQHAPGSGPLAAWDAHHLLLLDYELSVEIPPAAAGLREPTPGRLPLADYGHLHAGDRLHLALTWQATRPFDRDLKLFVHLLDPAGQVIAQVDPLAGAGAGPEGSDYLTGRWDPGELILEDVAISLPEDTPPGPYSLAVGLYDGETLERLPVVGQEDRRVVVEVGSRK